MRHSEHRAAATPAAVPGRRGARGFTLVELMITVALMAIVLAIGVPSFAGIINRNRLVAAGNEISGVLQLTRAEAIRRNRRVEICPSINGTSCSGADWSRMIVRVANTGEVVRDVRVPGAGIAITGSSNVTSNNRIAFVGSGFPRIGSGNLTTGGLSVCSSKVPVEANTLDIGIVASRVAVQTRNGTDACAARTD